ncbi:2Fe-2S iron-sulfur cluster-binding protein [Pannus brasiliensis CCIBt3594]|uniref:2Fe-2S iron-sulfur cluster-binding protein n=1 Tax=Pannus brasiliensis CCIBt3594 TaxID=1427578 RepID=A0AAW9QVE8_9CHRO
MPTITVRGTSIACDRGENLRRVLLKHDISLYNGGSALINCRGIGSCGTCAVEITGEVSEINWKEKARLSLPPHSPAKNRRLACQVKVFGDIEVKKYDGFWGQGDRLANLRENE